MKVSRPDPTIANELRDRVLARFPELATNPIPGVWFTGSGVATNAILCDGGTFKYTCGGLVSSVFGRLP